MMKRILFIAAMLWSVAYGQSKGYLRYDSVYIQKIGGNGELILENGTRNVTGGVLTNMGNGRTRFVLPSGGGGDSLGVQDTVQSAERYVNQDGNAFLWKNGKFRIRADLAPFGSRYVYNSATVTDQTPSATATINASGIRLEGGGNNLNNYVLLDDSIGAHNWTFGGSFVASEKSSTSLGVCFAFDAMGNGQNFYVFFQLADTSGYINGNLSAALPTGAEVNNRGVYTLKWSAGDTLRYEISRTSYKGFIRLYNKATNSATILEMPELQVSPTELRVYTLGGDWKILNDITLTYFDPVFPKWIFTGDSTDSGLTGDTEATNPYNIALDGVNDGVIDLSFASARSADLLFLLKDLGNFKGTYVFISCGVNDRNAGVSAATYGTNLRAIRDYVISIGGIPIFVNGVPQTAGSMVPYNDTMLTVANETGSLYIDIYTALVGVGTAMDADYNWGDGIHLNQLGNNVKGNAIRAKLISEGLLTFDSPLSIGTLPRSYRHNYEVTYDGNNLGAAIAGTNPNYLRVTPTTNIATKFTTGHAYLKGDLWTKTIAVGDAPQSGGYFTVNSSGQTLAAHFATSNNTIVWSNSTAFIAGRTVQLMLNGATQPVFNPVSGASFVIRQSNPNTPNVNLIVNTASASTIPSNYKIATFGTNTDTLSWFDRAGGLRVSDTTSGYTHPFDYTELGEDDWITKNLVDSLIGVAVIGGGGSTPGGSNTQLQYNNGGAFGGITGATSNGTVVTLTSALATTAFSPSSNDAAALGTTSLGWSDLHLATGAVINFANGNITATHSTGQIEWNGNVRTSGNFRLTGSTSAVQINDRSIPANLVAQLYGTGNVFHINVNSADRLSIDNNGRVGIGAAAPSARLELQAGTTTIGPLEFNSGTSLTTPVAGTMEYTTDDLFFTIATGTARKRILFADQTAGLTSGTVPVATTNGRLTDGLIIASTTYTPTLTNVTNVTASTLQSASYTRVGSIVTVTIKVEVDATGAGATELGIDLPVASNFADIDDLRGNVTEDTEVGAIEADITNDRIKLTYSAQGAGTDMFSIVLQYTII